MDQDIPFEEKVRQSLIMKMEGTDRMSQEFFNDYYLHADPEMIPILGDIMINDDDYYHRKAAALALESILEVKGLRHKVRGFVKQVPAKH